MEPVVDPVADPVVSGARADDAAPAKGPLAARARPAGRRAPFEVHLEVFTGPFDLLLQLISKHRLDVTEVALAAVTDEFVAHLRARSGGSPGETAAGADDAGEEWDLGQASEFLVVAATLLDLKAARLLPSGEVEDAEDLALLEARDLLFARLLQYRAYKDVSAVLADRLARFGRSVPRSAPLEPALAGLLPELVLSTTPEQLAELAAAASRPRPAPPGVGLAHLHGSTVSVREEALAVARHLRREGSATFRELVRDAGSVLVVVARFLALLELFRDGAVALEQADALAELSVRWTRPAGDGEDEDEALQGVVRGVAEPGEDAPS
ncbi:hypothetical protein GCM10009756_23930 [Pseudokineococcus marinus]